MKLTQQDFAMDEFQALCECNNWPNPFPLGLWETKRRHRHDPFVTVRLPSESFAIMIYQRSLLIRGIYQIIAQGNSIQDMFDDLMRFDLTRLSKTSTMTRSTLIASEKEARMATSIISKSYRVSSVWFGKKCPLSEQKKEIIFIGEFLSQLPGKIDLTKPEVVWCIISDYGDAAQSGHGKPLMNPLRVWFGYKLGHSGQTTNNRAIINKYSVKNRPYYGPTSLDSELSFIMANQAGVQTHHFVMDPFVGTGTILLSASHFGAYCLGTDIDIRTLRGDTGSSIGHFNIIDNFDHFGLQRPDLIRCDLSSNVFEMSHMFRGILDSIICDPPYGIRAGARKSGSKKQVHYHISEDTRSEHIPKTQLYTTDQCLCDLLDFAAISLKLGGRLVYIFPTTIDYKPSHLPIHPSLRLSGNSEQQCQGVFRRRLITMVKTRECKELNAATIPETPEPIKAKVMKRRSPEEMQQYYDRVKRARTIRTDSVKLPPLNPDPPI